ncbi:MAG: adenosylmethionine decarboxylase [Eubacteriales bacterium]|nr:adenosylmethionine decarboxylase [Eubacteriales bacterium]MDD3200102.1 adenosylmethionine decarboxylase [Eubacteriales bacterium]MDD4630387.1 adenosylmethionine decarboxylase [Eubacteriales bacterium]
MWEISLEKLQLHGFNNLTKTLSFNMYDICFTKSIEDRRAYIEYIDEQYNAAKLTEILRNVTNIIGAKILSIAVQDYDPQGASVTIMICEGSAPPESEVQVENPSVVAHLDKSHITVHTYPEYHPYGGVCTFRADIDVSTCGEISPLIALNYLIESFAADMMTLDYRVRGFTRDITGKKMFIDHKLNSIQNYISQDLIDQYYMIDVNVFQENIFHTKCKLRRFDLDNYFFNFSVDDISEDEINIITAKVRREMDEVFYGKNMPDK